MIFIMCCKNINNSKRLFLPPPRTAYAEIDSYNGISIERYPYFVRARYVGLHIMRSSFTSGAFFPSSHVYHDGS